MGGGAPRSGPQARFFFLPSLVFLAGWGGDGFSSVRFLAAGLPLAAGLDSVLPLAAGLPLVLAAGLPLVLVSVLALVSVLVLVSNSIVANIFIPNFYTKLNKLFLTSLLLSENSRMFTDTRSL